MHKSEGLNGWVGEGLGGWARGFNEHVSWWGSERASERASNQAVEKVSECKGDRVGK